MGELIDLFSTTRFTAEGPERARDLLGQAKTVSETPDTFEAPASRDSSSQTPRFEPEFNLIGRGAVSKEQYVSH